MSAPAAVVIENDAANDFRARVVEEGISAEVVPVREQDSTADINPEPKERNKGSAPYESRTKERRASNVEDTETKKMEANFSASGAAPRYMLTDSQKELPPGERSSRAYNQEAFHGNKSVLGAYEQPPRGRREKLGAVAQQTWKEGWAPGGAMGGQHTIAPAMGRPNRVHGLRYSTYRMEDYASGRA